jgi:hypothetical protein
MPELTEHEITRLATMAYELYQGSTDKGLITFLREDLPYRKAYADRRPYDNYHTEKARQLVAMEAALLRRLEELQEEREQQP